MRSILTFVGGGERDAVILETALAAASPLSAHLDCLHAHVPAVLAARYAHTEFASGAALRHALEELSVKSETFSALASENVRGFCSGAGIELCDPRPGGGCVTASFREETSNALEDLNAHATRSDLVVIGRARQKQGLAPDTLEHLVRNCGKPVLVAASAAPQTLTGTIMVCWRDSENTAAAVAAAAPFLAQAQRVVFVTVAKRDDGTGEALAATARELGAENAEVQVVTGSRRHVHEALAAAAEECGADLLIMGAYGRSRGREILFGSCTDMVLESNDRPILLAH